MTLTDLGYTTDIEKYFTENVLSDFFPARVTQEHKERYIVSDGENEYDAEITGYLRFTENPVPISPPWVTGLQ